MTDIEADEISQPQWSHGMTHAQFHDLIDVLRLRDAFHLSRNHYDRVGHFMQGFVPAIVAREVLLRERVVARGAWLAFLVVCVCLAISATYELVEWAAAALTGAKADAFLGMGDILALVERRDVSGMSFVFQVMPSGDRFERRDGMPVRLISDMLIRDISIVTYPAYEATDVQVAQRSLAVFRLQQVGQRVEWLSRQMQTRR